MTQYDDIIVSPTYGPLSHQYPTTLPYHSYGILTGIRPTPPQFYPSQEPVYSDLNTNSRQQYLRTVVSPQDLVKQRAQAKASPPNVYHVASTARQLPVSTHMNYIAPIPSSMRVNQIKSNAIGKSAYKVGLPVTAPIGSKSYYPSGTRTSLRRARSGGCVAPKKKGSIYNHSLKNGQVCAWGSLVRQTY